MQHCFKFFYVKKKTHLNIYFNSLSLDADLCENYSDYWEFRILAM